MSAITGAKRQAKYAERMVQADNYLTPMEWVPGGNALYMCGCGGVKVARRSNVKANLTRHCGDFRFHDDKRNRTKTPGQPSYSTAHAHVTGERGRAGDHACAIDGCEQTAGHWAYLHGSTSPLVQNHGTKDDGKVYADEGALYAPMCRAHHQAWDKAHLRQTNGNVLGLSLAHIAAWEAVR